MDVLITGGAGFIGSHLVDRFLTDGHNVTIVDDFSSPSASEDNLIEARKISEQSNLKLNLIKADISELSTWEQLPSHDCVCHFAAQTSVTVSSNDPELDYKINVLSIPLILNWVTKHKIKYLLYANTAGVLYGEAEKLPTDEDYMIYPESHYGATKSFFETYLRARTCTNKSSGIWSSNINETQYFSWASLRLGNVYGPRQKSKGESSVVPIFLEQIRDGITPTIFGDGSKTRDYVYISDVMGAFMSAFKKLQEEPLDGAYNVGSGVATSDLDLFNNLISVVREKGRPEYWKNSKNISNANFTSIRPGEIEKSSLDVKRLEKQLNVTAKVDLKTGLEKTLEYFENC